MTRGAALQNDSSTPTEVAGPARMLTTWLQGRSGSGLSGRPQNLR